MTGRPQNRPVPSDWASRCKVMGVLALRNHYRCGTAAIWRWAKESGVEPLQSRNRPKMTPPDDFAEFGAIETVPMLMERYDCSDSVIYRWRKLLGLTGPKLATSHKPLRPMPTGFAAVARTMSKESLVSHYQTNWGVITRWCEEAGITNKPAGRPTKPIGPAGVNVSVGADTSLAGQAAQHLRRIMPVFKASVISKDRSGYVVGGRHLATEEMVAMAQAKGFDPDAWKRVA